MEPVRAYIEKLIHTKLERRLAELDADGTGSTHCVDNTKHLGRVTSQDLTKQNGVV